jgi:hypothetical protein
MAAILHVPSRTQYPSVQLEVHMLAKPNIPALQKTFTFISLCAHVLISTLRKHMYSAELVAKIFT